MDFKKSVNSTCTCVKDFQFYFLSLIHNMTLAPALHHMCHDGAGLIPALQAQHFHCSTNQICMSRIVFKQGKRFFRDAHNTCDTHSASIIILVI